MVSVAIDGYNTSFEEDDNSLNVILKNEHNLICPNDVQVVNKSQIIAEFGLAGDLYTEFKRDYYNVIIYNEKDGTFFLRDGFSVARKDTVDGIKFQCTTIMPVEPPARITFPHRAILYESIRNLFFHVPMWFAMILLMFFSFITSIAYLSNGRETTDLVAVEAAKVGVFFGALGILTGMVWANYTWGAPWVNDPKLNGAAVGMLIYLAYFVLRGSLENEQMRAKVSAVYGVFAFVIFIVFIFVIPRMTDTLHPGSGGNPGFNMYDLDNTMRPVFYSGVLGFTLLGFWIVSLNVRRRLLERIADSE